MNTIALRVAPAVVAALLVSFALAAGPGYRVDWTGALQVVHREGDARPRIALADIEPGPETFALGPLAGLRGEITVVDGAIHVARIADGAVKVDSGLDVSAPFLVHGRVARWAAHPLPAEVRDLPALARWLAEAAPAAGLDADAPFPFKIETKSSTLRYHVIDNREPGDRVRAEHASLMRRFTLEGAPAVLIGVYSTGHAGVFTHHGEALHVHMVSADGARAGHLDGAELGAGTSVYLPAS